MATIAFIGLGIMGLPMAKNLVAAGHTVLGVNRSPQSVDALVAVGGSTAASARDAASGADVVITMLPDSPDVLSVVLGDDETGGVLSAMRPGALLIDMSTVAPATATRIAGEAARRGVWALDAPVSGGEAGAVEGVLSIMVGGEADAFAAALPLLQVLGTTVVHVGPAGSGQTVKAANQLMVAGNIQLLAEAITFLDAHGVDLASAVGVLGGGLAGSTVLQRKAAGMLAHEFTPGFRVQLHHKDLGIALAAAREAGVVVPVGALMAQLMGALVAQGDGALDHSALLRGVERLSGRERP